MIITLTNSFHNTEARVRLAPNEDLEDIEMDAHGIGNGTLDDERRAKRRIARVRAKLCGISGCTCGNTWGARG